MQEFLKLREKYLKLMDGRCGLDSLNRDLLIVWFISSFLNGFIRSGWMTIVLLLLPLAAGLRMFSTAVYKRSNENRKYLSFKSKVIEFFKMRYRIFKERKTHRYYKCKNCLSYIRVKRVKGEHYVDCPKCGKEIKVKIR